MSGIMIVLEGTDGSGKATQTKKLYQRLQKEGFDVQTIDFPRYGDDSSILVRKYLRGDFGKKPNDVNAYAASVFYAVDRYASYKEQWGDFYKNGGLLVLDRYTTANAVHQASKLPEDERIPYVDWLFHFEYDLMGIPKPTKVFYLDVPTEQTEKMMRKRESDTGTSADIHEKDEEYLKRCRDSARSLAEYCGWDVIQCYQNGSMRSIDDIHEEIYSRVQKLLRKDS